MKIILLKDVSNLGEEGDIVVVKSGYASNYLIPFKMATLYNRSSLSALEVKRDVINKRKEEKRLEARSQKEKLEDVEFTIEMQSGERGKLYGSLTPLMLVEKIEAEIGLKLNRSQVEIPKNHIKSLGIYRLKAKLYEGSIAILKVNVVSADLQKEELNSGDKEDNKTKTEAAFETGRNGKESSESKEDEGNLESES